MECTADEENEKRVGGRGQEECYRKSLSKEKAIEPSMPPFHHLLWQRKGRREFVVVFVLYIFSFLCLVDSDKSPERGGERNYKS